MHIPETTFLCIYDYGDGEGADHSQHAVCFTTTDIMEKVEDLRDGWEMQIFLWEGGRTIDVTDEFMAVPPKSDREEHSLTASQLGVGVFA